MQRENRDNHAEMVNRTRTGNSPVFQEGLHPHRDSGNVSASVLPLSYSQIHLNRLTSRNQYGDVQRTTDVDIVKYALMLGDLNRIADVQWNTNLHFSSRFNLPCDVQAQGISSCTTAMDGVLPPMNRESSEMNHGSSKRPASLEPFDESLSKKSRPSHSSKKHSSKKNRSDINKEKYGNDIGIVLQVGDSDRKAHFPLPPLPGSAVRRLTVNTTMLRQRWENYEKLTDAMDDNAADQEAFLKKLFLQSLHCKKIHCLEKTLQRYKAIKNA
jgi:hypothetical protein